MADSRLTALPELAAPSNQASVMMIDPALAGGRNYRGKVAAIILWLKLGTSAFRNVGVAANTVMAGDDSRVTGLRGAAYVNIGTTAGTAMAGDDNRITGLKGAAYLNVGTAAGTVMAGNDTRVTSLRGAAVLDVGTTAGTVMAGNDSRVSNLGSAASLSVGTTAGTIMAGNDSRVLNALPATGGTSTGRQTFNAGISVSGNSGFFGAAPIARPSITGSRGTETEAAASFRAALVALGLVSDNTIA